MAGSSNTSNARRLGLIAVGIFLSVVTIVAGVVIYRLLDTVERRVVKISDKTPSANAGKKAPENPWKGKQKRAIQQVRRAPRLTPGQAPPLKERLHSNSYIRYTLNLHGVSASGWRARWWGKTRFGDAFYGVMFQYRDGTVKVGPEWVVNLESGRVVPKNLLAEVVERPVEATQREYLKKTKKIHRAIRRYAFADELVLASVATIYVSRREGIKKVGGWRIQHDRADVFRAYLQWQDAQGRTHAAFEFDSEKGKLRPVNLHAARILNLGRELGNKDPSRPEIRPASYRVEVQNARRRWRGKSRDKCVQNGRVVAPCRALSTVLQQDRIVHTLAWLLQERIGSAKAFARCRELKECAWHPESRESEGMIVEYRYNLADAKGGIEFEVGEQARRIAPLGKLSKIALGTAGLYRQLHESDGDETRVALRVSD